MTYHDVQQYQTDDGTIYAVEVDDQDGKIRLSKQGSTWYMTQADSFRIATMLMQGVGAAPAIVSAVLHRTTAIEQAHRTCNDTIDAALKNAKGHTIGILHAQGHVHTEDYHGKAKSHGSPFDQASDTGTPPTTISGKGGPW